MENKRRDTVPHDVAMDVLKILPEKARMRFKCVSKTWYSSIKGTILPLIVSFTNSSFSQQHFLTIEHQSDEASHLLTVPSDFKLHRVTQLINGFICFYNIVDFEILMRNVVTQEIIDLPKSTFVVSDDDEDFSGPMISYFREYFLGFDPSSRDYKVLNISNKHTTNSSSYAWMIDNHGTPECEIFTLGTTSWRKIDAPPSRIHFRRQGLCANGFIHWIITNPRKTKPVLAVFDVKEEKFDIVKLPDEVRKNHDLIQAEEKLGVLDCDDFRSKNKIRVWILKDYGRGGGEVWIRRDYVFRFDTIMFRPPIPVSNSNNGEILLTEYKSSLVSRVFIYDLKTQERRAIKIPPVTEQDVVKFLDLKRARDFPSNLKFKRRNLALSFREDDCIEKSKESQQQFVTKVPICGATEMEEGSGLSSNSTGEPNKRPSARQTRHQTQNTQNDSQHPPTHVHSKAGPLCLRTDNVPLEEHPRIEHHHGYTPKMENLINEEVDVIRRCESDAVIRIKKLLLMSKSGTLHVHALRLIRTELGLPEDFRDSILGKYGNDFRLVDLEIVELVNRDENLGDAVVEKWRENEYREKWLSEFETNFAFPINFPTGFKIERGFREKLKNWQRLPYVKPYERKENVVRVCTCGGFERFEKRSVAVIHELLSLTVEKRVEVERLSHFRKDFAMEVNVRELLLKHPGIFYISTKGGTQTVFLREAYSRGCLIEPNPIYVIRRKMLDLVLLGCRNTKELKHLEEIKQVSDNLVGKIGDGGTRGGDWVVPIFEPLKNDNLDDNLDETCDLSDKELDVSANSGSETDFQVSRMN
ncbi:hypothetical protein WN944_005029 [Citrus x changshan-huyou]|uniref:PORR domain-containing protein n=1 Tax=Citrus x changshan-huyou TaxID=2935761 RepID=A0AAP0QIE6_9ROSI